MKSRLVQSMAALLAGTGMALGQGPGTPPANGRPLAAERESRPATPYVEPAPGHPAYGMTGSPYAGAANSFTVLGSAAGAATEAPATGTAPSHSGGPACGPNYCGADGGRDRGLYAGSRVWGGIEYLLWWTRDGNLPVILGAAPGTLATVSPLPAGAINPLFGGPAGQLDYDEHSGVRLTAGLWLDPDQQVGVEGNYWQLGRESTSFAGSSSGDPILGPVFTDAVTGRQTLIALASPNRLTGTVAAGARDRLWGFEANARFRTTSIFGDRCDFLVGFRHLQFDEGLLAFSTGTFLPTVPVFGGTRLAAFDAIGVHNRFYALQGGLSCDYRWCSWYLNVTTKVAMGVMNEQVNIQGGSSITTAAGVTTLHGGGVLAQPTNIGKHTSDKFAIMPEVTVNLGYQVTEQFRAFIGYNFFWITSVARPGDQIDVVDNRAVRILSSYDPTVVTARPYNLFQTEHFWAQGLNLGLEFRY